MEFAEAAFIGITRIDDIGDHRAYNEWHQLDHRPENLLLDGVAWGERWVRSPDCVAATAASVGEWDDFHYFNTYWFRPPVADAIDEWAQLADRSFHWGRRPEISIVSRPFMSFFRPVSGAAAPRVLVSPDALPFRPNRGLYVTVTRTGGVAARARAELEQRYAWYAREGFPAMLARRGVAGVWAFAGSPELAPPAWAQQEASADPGVAQSVRIHVYFCDGDPTELAEEIATSGVDGTVLAPGGEVEELLFAGPLRSITPWEWDWFER
jgi:hypothetical protein